MKKEADWKGFVSAASKMVDEYNKNSQAKKKKPNTTNIFTIQENITKKTILVADFGTSDAAQISALNWPKYSEGGQVDRESSGLPENCFVTTGPK
ncbi:uncharacterized protein N7483_000361 [Penicillium malachiteum]|uniref:uncharacterized protein n=1 Tax=Penicillium malachiteum TaxID=1324776 RepID=UPI0025486E4B|nr:uncharacterized protein N7483_000361 [Penicillium malachiteum]KAJ5735236.1 hypothetical protein N7483_000361 [Penicillium malachiteum]